MGEEGRREIAPSCLPSSAVSWSSTRSPSPLYLLSFLRAIFATPTKTLTASSSILLNKKNKNKTRNKSRNKIKDKREAKNLRLGDKLGPRLIRDNVTEGRDLALELARLVGPLEDRRLVLGSGRHVVSLLVLREVVVVVAGDSEA